MRLKKRAPLTIKRYSLELNQFCLWSKDASPSDFSARDIELGYLAWWTDRFEFKNHREPLPTTVKNHIQALRAFYEFLERFDYLIDDDGKPARNPVRGIEAPKTEQRVSDWLRDADDIKLVEMDYGKNLRARFLVLMLRFTGLRISELLDLRWTDIDLAERKLTVRRGKTSKARRTLPLDPQLVPLLKSWEQWSRANHRYDADELRAAGG
jgi:site-specific recombinase XerD